MIPTPTPWPTPLPSDIKVFVDVNQFRIWSFADDAQQMWQQFGRGRTDVLQWAIILIIVVVSIFFLVKLIQSMLPENQDSKGKSK